MAQQTAVEWLFMMLANHNILNHKVLADNKHLTELTYKIKTEAKQMEKEQMFDAFMTGEAHDICISAEQYYKKTYGKE